MFSKQIYPFFFLGKENYDTTKKKKKVSLHVQSTCDKASSCYKNIFI